MQMSQRISSISPSNLKAMVPGNTDLYVSEDIAILRSLKSLKASPAADLIHTPQYIEVGRILLVTRGRAVHEINLVPFETFPGNVLIIPQNTYIRLSYLSEDYEGQMISFSQLPTGFEKCTRLNLGSEDFRRMQSYINLLWDTVHSAYERKCIEHLQTALMYDLKHMASQNRTDTTAHASRGQQLFQQFLDALGRADSLPRSVKAYSDELCVTPNHLSAVVKQQSGRSVMDWLNAQQILRAQVLLRHSDLQIGEIADRLGFQSATFFSRFFKRETGMTPKEYRAGSLTA